MKNTEKLTGSNSATFINSNTTTGTTDYSLINSTFVNYPQSNPYFNSVSTSAGCYATFNTWSTPERVEIIEHQDRIEFVYKETSMTTLTIHPSPSPMERVFKVVFSCIDGKWNKSDRIYGEIVEQSNEHYNFDK